MPFIRIESLPFEQPIDLPSIVRGINRDVSESCALELEHLHTCWSTIPSGCYAKGDSSPDYQPELKHPVIVELLTPEDFQDEKITTILETIAASISRHACFPQQNIFIHHVTATSGRVYDDGKIATW